MARESAIAGVFRAGRAGKPRAGAELDGRRRTCTSRSTTRYRNSLGLSTIFAVLPLITLFVLLGGLQGQGAVGRADVARGRDPRGDHRLLACRSARRWTPALEGAAFGLFPIMWIVVNAIWIYNMTVETGHFAVLRRSFGRVSDDQRIQAVIIAFCFGALLEALAGFGTPVAICSVMLIALGFKPIKAAVRRAGGQHRAGRLRRDRDPDHHARRRRTGLPKRRPRLDGRPPDAVPRADRAADPGRHGRRPARPAPDLAGGAGRRARLRRRPVRLLELHLGRAHRHRGLAGLGGRARRLPARLAAVRAAPRRGRAARVRGPRSRAPRPTTRPSSARSPNAATTRPATRRARRPAGLRALPDHHRGASRSRRSAGCPSRTSSTTGPSEFSLARPARAERARARRPRRSRSSSTGPTRRARCCCICGLLTMAALRVRLRARARASTWPRWTS